MCRPIRLLLLVGFLLAISATVTYGQGLGVTGDLVTRADGSRILSVRSVIINGLAHRLGIVSGDQIININGFAPGDALNNQQALAAGGGRVSVVISRRGAVLRLGDRQVVTPGIGIPGYIEPTPGHQSGRYPITPRPLPPGQRPGPDLLVDLEEVEDLSGRRVRVRSVNASGRGFREGLRAGDIIESVNGLKARSLRDVRDSYYFRSGKITITYLRGSVRNRIAIVDRNPIVDRPTERKSLGLTTVLSHKREVRVNSATADGLGAALGIAQRGTIISKVNGTPIKTPDDIKRLDQAILEGKFNYLEIEFTPFGGRTQVVRRRL